MAESQGGSGLSRSSIEAYGGILVGIAAVVIPSWWAQAVLIIVAAGLAIHLSLQSPLTLRRKLSIRIGICILSAALILGGGGLLVQHQYLKENPAVVSAAAAPSQSEGRKTLSELYKLDFPRGVKLEQSCSFSTPDGKSLTVGLVKRVLDFDEGTKFVAFYIPSSDISLSIFYYIADNIQSFVNPKEGVVSGQKKSSGDSMAIKTGDMKFSGLVYLYSENDLDLSHKAQLEDYYRAKGLLMQFRSFDYEAFSNK